MIDLEVKNFQAIGHTHVRVNGFAAIVGRSNIGKSSLVRALQCVLTGAVGTDFVRHGSDCDRRTRGTKKCKCFSQVTFRNHKIQVTWEKGDHVNRYTVFENGSDKPVVYEGLERGTPPFLLPDFQLVKVGDSKELVQVSSQFEPIFLLNQSGPAVADVLSDVAKLDDLNKAMALATKDRKDAVAKKRVRGEDVETLRRALSQYDSLDTVDVQGLLESLNSLQVRHKTLGRVDGFIAKLVGFKTVLSGLSEALEHDLPDERSLDSSVSRLWQCVRFSSQHSVLQESVEGCERALAPDLPDRSDLEARNGKLLKADKFIRELTEKAPLIRQLSGIDQVEIPDASTLHEALGKVIKANTLLQRLESLTASLQKSSSLEDIPDLDTNPLMSSLDRLDQIDSWWSKDQRALDTIGQISKEIAKAEETEAKALEELKALGVCPVCNQDIGEGHRLHLEGF